MIRQSQKDEEQAHLQAFLECLGMKSQVENLQCGEAPDFKFDYEGRTVGLELTGYHNPKEVEAGGTRRGIEAEWE
ncbi:MAG TPA: hypothetical protein VIE68_06320, partial [Gemmatimonadota bacterium]